MSTLNQYITKKFQVISENLSLEAAIEQLQNKDYGVIEDSQQRPIALVLSEDLTYSNSVNSLQQAITNLPTTIIVDNDVEMRNFTESSAKKILIREKNARGAIVLNKQRQIEGILSVQKFREYLRNEYQRREDELSFTGNITDSGLAGTYTQVTFRQICRKCFYVNSFDEQIWKELTKQKLFSKCQNPKESEHVFEVNKRLDNV